MSKVLPTLSDSVHERVSQSYQIQAILVRFKFGVYVTVKNQYDPSKPAAAPAPAPAHFRCE